MRYSFPPDLSQLVGEQMASGKYTSEDDLLRTALRALAKEEEDLAAVRKAIGDWRAGDSGVPLDAAFAAIRAKYQPGKVS